MASDFDDLITMDHRAPLRIIVYGGEGVGKTTQAAKAKKALFIQTEDGLGDLKVPALPRCDSYEQLIEQLEMVASRDHNYSTIVLDSLDWADILIQRRVSLDNKVNEIAEIPYGRGKLYCTTYWAKIKEILERIRARGCTIILIGHSSVTRIDDPLNGDYDKHSLKINKDSAALLKEWADIIIFAQYSMLIKKEDKGFGNKKNRAIADGSRVMYLSGTPLFDAKNRYGLPDKLPFDWAEFQRAFKEATNKGE